MSLVNLSLKLHVKSKSLMIVFNMYPPRTTILLGTEIQNGQEAHSYVAKPDIKINEFKSTLEIARTNNVHRNVYFCDNVKEMPRRPNFLIMDPNGSMIALAT